MNTELFETAIDLVESAIEAARERESRPVEHVGECLTLLAELCGLPPLGKTQEEYIAKSILGKPIEPPTNYKLCNRKSGMPLEYVPNATFNDVKDVQLANGELRPRGLVWRSDFEIAEQLRKECDEYVERTRWHLHSAERDAINAFAAENGRTWKHKLRQAWQRGDAPAPLQYLATHRCFGPDGLARYKASRIIAAA